VANYQRIFGIDFFLNPEALCAVELAKLIRHPSRVAVENFARGQIEVQQQRVAEGSRLIGRALKDLKIDPRVRVGYVQREGRTRVANADTTLQKDDLVTVFGHPDPLFAMRERFDPKSKVELTRVVLFGGSETAINLIRILSNPRFKIRVIEKDPDRCRALAERFPRVTFIHGDATSLRLLEEEQIDSAHYFVACTKDDEENILTCIQASKLGARHVQLVINKGDYDALLGMLKTTLAIEVVVSPRQATADFMLRSLSTETVSHLATLPDGNGRILEVRITHASPCVGRTVKEIHLPRGSLFVALLHKFKARVPAADDKILAGDRVVVMVDEEQEKALLERLV